jgi:hypothetical protein
MTQEAKAGSRNGGRKPGTGVLAPPPGGLPDNWPDTGWCPARKGADVLVEYDRTAKMFHGPNDSRTKAYVTGRMG